jgi:CubicO group peptidase (beta-lactamase class C family)
MWDAKGATVKRVMSHTSGLTTFNAWCRGDSTTCAKTDAAYISRYAILVWPPGDHFDYSNLGYGLLDRLVSSVSNLSFPEYMRREVFTPLGMKNSYVATDLNRLDRAIRYSSADLSRFEFSFSHSYSAGASLVYSSVHDLALFAMLHLNDINPKNRIISKRSVDAMQDTVARNGSEYYGLGWWIRNDFYGYKGALAQGGTFFGSAWLQLIPSEDIAIAILTNSGGGDISAILHEVLSGLLPKFKEQLAVKTSVPEVRTGQVNPVTPGTWNGTISTYRGNLPLTFYFNGTADSFVDFDNVRHIKVTHVETRPEWYSFSFEGDLGLEGDTGRGPYNLTFYLNQKADVLYGSVETSGSVHPDTPQLAYWVKLQKVN